MGNITDIELHELGEKSIPNLIQKMKEMEPEYSNYFEKMVPMIELYYERKLAEFSTDYALPAVANDCNLKSEIRLKNPHFKMKKPIHYRNELERELVKLLTDWDKEVYKTMSEAKWLYDVFCGVIDWERFFESEQEYYAAKDLVCDVHFGPPGFWDNSYEEVLKRVYQVEDDDLYNKAMLFLSITYMVENFEGII